MAAAETTNATQNVTNGLSSALKQAHSIKEAITLFIAQDGFLELTRLVNLIPEMRETIRLQNEKALKAEQRFKESSKDMIDNFHKRYSEFEEREAQLMEEIKNAEQKIKDRTISYETVQSERDALKKAEKKLSARYEKEKGEHEASKSFVKSMKEQLTAQEVALDKASGKLQAFDNKLASLKKENDQLKKDYKIALQDADGFSQELRELRGYSQGMHDADLPRLKHDIERWWHKTASVVAEMVGRSLPDEVIQCNWSLFAKSAKQKHGLSIPQSNSSIAREMRTAAFLAFLASAVNAAIFRPTYAVHGDEGDDLRETLLLESVRNQKRESFLRGILLAVESDNETDNNQELLSTVLDAMHKTGVQDLMVPSCWERLFTELETLLGQIVEIWKYAQLSLQKIEPMFEVDGTDQEAWSEFSFSSFTGEGKHAKSTDRKSEKQSSRNGGAHGFKDGVVIFPRFYHVRSPPDVFISGMIVPYERLNQAEGEIAALTKKSSNLLDNLKSARDAGRSHRRTSSGMSTATNKRFLDSKNGSASGPDEQAQK